MSVLVVRVCKSVYTIYLGLCNDHSCLLMRAYQEQKPGLLTFSNRLEFMMRKTTWCTQFCHLSAYKHAKSFYLHLGIQIKCKIPGSVKSRQHSGNTVTGFTYLTPRNLGCSPGADVSVSIFRESMWAMEMTVAATYHGRPMKEQTIIRMATQNRSKW